MKSTQPNGFTLIESLIVLAVLSVLLLLAVPSFRDFHRSSQLSSQTNTLVAAIHTAKNEAIKRNSHSYLVPTDGSNWNAGWMVFVDDDFSASFNAGDVKVVEGEALPSNMRIDGTGTASGGTPYISFNGSGYPRDTNNNPANLTLSLKFTGLSGAEEVRNTRRIKLAITGRVRSCKPSSSSDSSCNTSSTQ